MREEKDWIAIEREYAKADLSVAQIARKFGASPSAVRRRAAKEGWQRNAWTGGAPAEGGGDQMESLREAAMGMSKVLTDLFTDDKQFMRHQYTDRSTGEVRDTVLESRNIKSMRDAIAAIRDMTETVRALYGIMTPQEVSGIELARAKLRLEEQKLSSPDAGAYGETGVILLPDIGDA